MAQSKWHVESDPSSCIGAGVCASVVPGRFRLTGGLSEPIASVIEPDEDVVVAANLCPMSAITVTEVDTGAVVAPLD